jgi:preprotein translocase subunit SecB
MGQLPTLQRVQLKKVLFPHFEFECLETEAGQLLAPQLQAAMPVVRTDEGRYAVEIEFRTDAEHPSSFRALVVVRLELDLADDGSDASEEEIAHFLQVNGMILVWPYLRELISSATVRMGFPALFIPMLDVSKIYFGHSPLEEEPAADSQDKPPAP